MGFSIFRQLLNVNMVKDNRRIAPPDNCTSPSTFETSKIETIINDDGLRLDSRSFEDLRPINLKPGVVPGVTGSAYLEWGNTKVIASVNGPRDVLHKSDSLSKGQVYCEFKYATFSCKERQQYMPTDEEISISKSIEKALEPVILLEKFPKARLDIHIIVLENDGAAISAGIICAGIALSNAGVEMYDLPVGCTLINTGEQILIDPTAKEESYRKSEEYAKVILCMMPAYNNQVIFLNNTGSFQPLFHSKALKILRNKCQIIFAYIKNFLKQHVKKTCSSLNSGDLEMEDFKSIKAADLKLFQPHKYMRAHLENNIRPDGRELKEFRSVLINVGALGTAYGSALVRLDNTSVLCGVKADLTIPTSEEPNKGFVVPNVTLTPVCSSKFQPGPPGEQAQAYSRIIMDLVLNSDFINLSSLCISESKLAWCLFVEIICLSHDGNILDACLLAMMAALKNTKLPEININIEDEKIEVSDKFVPLNLNYFVFPATFAHLENQVVADPSEEEENLANGSLTVFVKEDNSVLVHLFGVLKEEDICSSINCARARYKEMKQLVETLN